VTFGVTLLGTGGPAPDLERAQPAAVVRCGEDVVLVDCGDAATTQLLRAGIDPGAVTTLLLTHLHWDHVLGYPGLVWGGWARRRSALRVLGPAGTAALHESSVSRPFAEQARWVQEAAGWDGSGWEGVEVEEVGHGHTLQVGAMRITYGRVLHPPIEAYGLRIEHEGRTIVLSGDTARCGELVELGAGADLLVADACASPSAPHDSAFIERLHAFHADARDAGEMAAAAGARRLVLTHMLPGAEPDRLANDAAAGFDGDVHVGADLETYVV